MYWEDEKKHPKKLVQKSYDDLGGFVDFINKNNYTWNAKMNERYEGMTLAEVQNHLKYGGIPESHRPGRSKFTLA